MRKIITTLSIWGIIATLLPLWGCDEHVADVPFDSQKWKKIHVGDDIHNHQRQAMVADLMRRKILLGRNEKQVTFLLGVGHRVVLDGVLEVSYNIGFEQGASASDYEMLVLKFKNGVVYDVSVVHG
jgi:hypothetical protein